MHSCRRLLPRRRVRGSGSGSGSGSGHEGIPVKLIVVADLMEVAEATRVPPPFDTAAVDLSRVRRVILIVDHA